ncbi:MAG: ATP-dependent DNA helicase RecG [Candidatus Magasanikbacteria bacterium RIFCSPHIGHO2_02_FULL_41_13]|uniref:ATP-dependent DNA helicase RecG n=1 Tax=Candidatus Magasanikbacteria bacterium RIFCSPHIGHO2_02_FULL_41_13 TaxID=1798676 RepID=A0A1F6M5L3_9BACT|nr:MAG: ATP-dependent DNA helicase RecG [Candidatus Magasanikbacteria bacterium RIFCSPHIGHO2_02_FULL_41_13]
MDLKTPISKLHRVGKALETRLAILGIATLEDLLFYYPFRYEDYSQVVPIEALEEGTNVTVKVKIEQIATKRSPRKHMLLTEAVVYDETGRMHVVWFNQAFIGKVLKAGETIYLSGVVKHDMLGVTMQSPSYEKVVTSPQPSPLHGEGTFTAHTARIVPIYSVTNGITQKQMRFLLTQVLPLAKDIRDWIPEDILKKANLEALEQSLQSIHFPSSTEDLKKAEYRLKFDELFILQLRSEMIRQELKIFKAPTLTFQDASIKEFVVGLPFELTKDQKIAAWEILQDLERIEPMNRLLEGDVGSGKTVVAAMAMYNAILNGHQAVIMAPTEILASQHYETLQKIFEKYDVKIALLSRSQFQILNHKFLQKSKSGQKKEVIEKIKDGIVQIVIGTHALLTEDVQFKKLGFVVVDEQHRFGVEQRKTIRDKSGQKNITPHFLSMTATPIPRSFALTLYGDLDLSIIKTKPSGRKPILTRLVEAKNREKAYEFIRAQVAQGRQVFVICPLITESSKDEKQSISLDERKTVLKEYEKLSSEVFPRLKVDFLHGKLKGNEKDEKMKKFAAGQTDILVSTSVVEVGVNIPNATVMMIEDAELFGLAQLHQFRGRVGRSNYQSYCFLLTDSSSQSALDRLRFFEKTLDGFELSEYDLQTRGPGEVYGTAQSGMMNLRLATLQDTQIIKLARGLARGIEFKNYPSLKEKIRDWEKKVHLE